MGLASDLHSLPSSAEFGTVIAFPPAAPADIGNAGVAELVALVQANTASNRVETVMRLRALLEISSNRPTADLLALAAAAPDPGP